MGTEGPQSATSTSTACQDWLRNGGLEHPREAADTSVRPQGTGTEANLLPVAQLSGLEGGCPPEMEKQGAERGGERQDPCVPRRCSAHLSTADPVRGREFGRGASEGVWEF